MHAAGFVHRAVKPANVLWLPRRRRWMVVDFHASAATAAAAPLQLRLPYAPPEVARAYASGETEAPAAEAHDAWALGVLAHELLSGQPLFTPAEEGVNQVCRCASSRRPPDILLHPRAPAVASQTRHGRVSGSKPFFITMTPDTSARSAASSLRQPPLWISGIVVGYHRYLGACAMAATPRTPR